MSVRVRIDRIVLDGYGFGPRERAQFEASLGAELTRLLGGATGAQDGSAPFALARSYAVPVAIAPAVDLVADAGPVALGSAVARSVQTGLRR